MHTVELLEQALDAAVRLGYTVREESMAGLGGACVLKGKKILFLDLDLDPAEQLEQVVEALGQEPEVISLDISRELSRQLQARKIA